MAIASTKAITVVLVDEAHLEVELGELGLAVAAQVLVAEAAGDLEVAVDAGDHQQLLELLRALRQGVDAARLEARRDDEVAGALRRRLDERRRLDLDEAVRVVDLADGLDHAAAEQQAVGHRLAADVEVAVLEAEALVDRGVRLVDVEGRRLRLGQDRRPRDARSSISPVGSFAFSVPARRGATSPATLTTNSLRTRLGDGVGLGRLGPVDDDLGDPVAVAQVEEDQLPVVAAAVDPAGQAGVTAGVGRPQLARGVRPIGRGEAGWIRSWPAYGTGTVSRGGPGRASPGSNRHPNRLTPT